MALVRRAREDSDEGRSVVNLGRVGVIVQRGKTLLQEPASRFGSIAAASDLPPGSRSARSGRAAGRLEVNISSSEQRRESVQSLRRWMAARIASIWLASRIGVAVRRSHPDGLGEKIGFGLELHTMSLASGRNCRIWAIASGPDGFARIRRQGHDDVHYGTSGGVNDSSLHQDKTPFVQQST